MKTALSPCPLCSHTQSKEFTRARKRDYLICPHCGLVFVTANHLLSPAEEKERYDHHQNDPTDSGYRKFLRRLADPLQGKLPPGACGIDFGCGPGPTLSLLFQEAGFSCENYDPLYANDPSLLDRQYDFLACSETIEHMHHPGHEFSRFTKLVRPGGWIGIMTQLQDGNAKAFQNWFYKDDETHICFFSKRSFEWLAETHHLHLEFHPNGVVLFRR